MGKCTQITAAAFLVGALLLTGCATESTPSTSTTQTSTQRLLETHGLAGVDAVEMIDSLDRIPQLDHSVGELGNQDIHLKIVDDAGEVLVDESRMTFDNGFIGVWVPAGSIGAIEISYDGMTGTSEFSTSDDAATCITDLQLS